MIKSMNHLTEPQITAYRDRALTSEERATVSSHMEGCEPCRTRVRNARNVVGAAASAAIQFLPTNETESGHLTYEEMAAYVDGKADEAVREVVEGHAQFCERCAEQVRELRGFQAMLSTYPKKEYAPFAGAGFLRRAAERLKSRGGRFFLFTLLPSAATAVVVALIMMRHAERPMIRRPGDSSLIASARQDAEIRRLRMQEREARDEAASLKRRLQVAERDHAAASSAPLVAGRPVRDKDGRLFLPVQIPHDLAVAYTHRDVALPKQVAALVSDHTVAMGDEGPNATFSLLSPCATFVSSTSPMFAWQSVPGATKYTIQVKDKDDRAAIRAEVTKFGSKWVVTVERPESMTGSADESAEGIRWTPPNRCRLQPGEAYTWSVAATRADGTAAKAPPHGEVNFKTLTAAESTKVAVEIGRYGTDDVLAGLIYAQHGLLDDADAAFRKAEHLNPNDQTVKDLLTKLQTARRKRTTGR